MDIRRAPSKTELRCLPCGAVTLSTSELKIISPEVADPKMRAGVSFTCPLCAQTRFQALARRERAALLAAGAQIAVGASAGK